MLFRFGDELTWDQPAFKKVSPKVNVFICLPMITMLHCLHCIFLNHLLLATVKSVFNFWLCGSHTFSEGESHIIWQLVPYKGTWRHKTTPTTQRRTCKRPDVVPELPCHLPFAWLIFEIWKFSLHCASLSRAASFFACPVLQRANTR